MIESHKRVPFAETARGHRAFFIIFMMVCLCVLWIMWEQTAEDNISLAKQNAVVHVTKPHTPLRSTPKPDESVWIAPPDLSIELTADSNWVEHDQKLIGDFSPCAIVSIGTPSLTGTSPSGPWIQNDTFSSNDVPIRVIDWEPFKTVKEAWPQRAWITPVSVPDDDEYAENASDHDPRDDPLHRPVRWSIASILLPKPTESPYPTGLDRLLISLAPRSVMPFKVETIKLLLEDITHSSSVGSHFLLDQQLSLLLSPFYWKRLGQVGQRACMQRVMVKNGKVIDRDVFHSLDDSTKLEVVSDTFSSLLRGWVLPLKHLDIGSDSVQDLVAPSDDPVVDDGFDVVSQSGSDVERLLPLINRINYQVSDHTLSRQTKDWIIFLRLQSTGSKTLDEIFHGQMKPLVCAKGFLVEPRAFFDANDPSKFQDRGLDKCHIFIPCEKAVLENWKDIGKDTCFIIDSQHCDWRSLSVVFNTSTTIDLPRIPDDQEKFHMLGLLREPFSRVVSEFKHVYGEKVTWDYCLSSEVLRTANPTPLPTPSSTPPMAHKLKLSPVGINGGDRSVILNRESFLAFVTNDIHAWGMQNRQARMVAGCGDRPCEFLYKNDGALLRTAQRHMLAMDWFSLLDRFDDCLHLANHQFLWKIDQYYKRKEERDQRFINFDIKHDDLLREIVYKLNQLDIQLYDFSTEILLFRLWSMKQSLSIPDVILPVPKCDDQDHCVFENITSP